MILATSGGRGGRLFLRWFMPHFDRAAALRALPDAARRRLADPNVSDGERQAVRLLVQRAGTHLGTAPP